MFFQQIFKTLEVHSSILGIDLVHEIKQKLLMPLWAFCHAIPFDINTMVLCEMTKGKWKEVQADEQRSLVYFGNFFLKPSESKKKSGTTPIFNVGAPQMFKLVFQKIFGTIFKLRRTWRCIKHPCIVIWIFLT